MFSFDQKNYKTHRCVTSLSKSPLTPLMVLSLTGLYLLKCKCPRGVKLKALVVIVTEQRC